MKKHFFWILPVFVLFFAACGSKGFEQTSTGLLYKFHERNKGPKAGLDNIVKVEMAFRYPADSVFLRNLGYNEPVYLSVQPSEYAGDIHEGMRMLSVGDSVTFKLDAGRFFTVTMRTPTLPEFITPGDSMYIDIRMLEIFTQTEFQEYQRKQREEMIKEAEVAAHQEEGLRERFLIDNNITTQPEESGLIIVIKEQGSGPKPEPGQTVTVHYTGMVLDGTVFDSSVERGDPFRFQLGRGQVIRGWDEGISKLNIGSKARLIIPSYLAYGDQQRGAVIKPYSTLIFDVELIAAE
ncbi:MAG: FKBP-type peptidyl-prolyl cis-trans isomerase [Bacteroidales bacterium]